METSVVSMVQGNSVDFQINSEYEPLEVVLVHEPGSELDRILPHSCSDFLFHDIPFLRQAREEYANMIAVLQNLGVRILHVETLLAEILHDTTIREGLVADVCVAAGQPSLTESVLSTYSPSEVASLLIVGIAASELRERTSLQFQVPSTKDDPFLLPPIPNLCFTRDTLATVNSYVVSCNMHHSARAREALLVRDLFRHHPYFAPNSIVFGDRGMEGCPYCIEGGDIIVLNEEAIAVASGRRTRSESIVLLASRLFLKGAAKRIYEVTIPGRTPYLHLDSVFSIVGPGMIVAHPNAMDEIREVTRWEPFYLGSDTTDVDYENVKVLPYDDNRGLHEILEEELGSLTVIHTAGGTPGLADREQHSGGTDVLAIGPKKVVAFDRNVRTNDALTRAGVTVFEIPSSELVRGGGSPKSMAAPLRRRRSEG